MKTLNLFIAVTLLPITLTSCGKSNEERIEEARAEYIAAHKKHRQTYHQLKADHPELLPKRGEPSNAWKAYAEAIAIYEDLEVSEEANAAYLSYVQQPHDKSNLRIMPEESAKLASTWDRAKPKIDYALKAESIVVQGKWEEVFSAFNTRLINCVTQDIYFQLAMNKPDNAKDRLLTLWSLVAKKKPITQLNKLYRNLWQLDLLRISLRMIEAEVIDVAVLSRQIEHFENSESPLKLALQDFILVEQSFMSDDPDDDFEILSRGASQSQEGLSADERAFRWELAQIDEAKEQLANVQREYSLILALWRDAEGRFKEAERKRLRALALEDLNSFGAATGAVNFDVRQRAFVAALRTLSTTLAAKTKEQRLKIIKEAAEASDLLSFTTNKDGTLTLYVQTEDKELADGDPNKRDFTISAGE